MRAAVLALLAGLASWGGCGAPADGYSGPRGTVAGRMTLDGAPLTAGCQVLFMATRGGFVASGKIGPDGRYALAYRVRQGLPVGDYLVQVARPESQGPAASGTADVAMAAPNLEDLLKAWEASLPFPARYQTASTSGLKFAVRPGANTADFDLAKGKNPLHPGGAVK